MALTRARRVRATLGRGGALLAGLAFVATMLIVGAPIAAASTNLLTNGDFETGTTTGWAGGHSSLSVSSVPAPHGGTFAGKVTYSGTGTTYVIKSSPVAVSSTTGGVVYTADGWLRSDTPGKKVCLKLTESGSQTGNSTLCLNSTSSWAALPEANYTASASGDTLLFSVIAKKPVSGDSFEVDDLSLTTGCGASVCPPANLRTTNASSNEVDLAWDASPTPSVVSYTIYRGADCLSLVQIGSVSAPATTFADTTVSPSTSYAYAVDASDGVNSSVQSNCLPVTTLSASTGASWLMDETSGTTMVDSGGLDNGTINNVALGQPGHPGDVGTSYGFDGTISYVSVPNDPSLNPGTADISITAWLDFTAMAGTGDFDFDIIRKGGGWKMEIFPHNGLSDAQCVIKGTITKVSLHAPQSNGTGLNDGVWHQVTCARTASGESLTIDGSVVAQSSVQVGSIFNAAGVFLGSQAKAVDFYNGLMDDVSVAIG